MTSDTYIYICILIMTIVVSSSMIILILERIKKNRDYYNTDYVHIDNTRKYYEDLVHSLQMELSDNERRWKDINHLLINGQLNEKKLLNCAVSNKLISSNYFENLGIDINNISIEKKSVFVLTPFSKKEEQTYNIINSVCSEVDLKCSRGDEVFRDGTILSHIIKSILQSSIIIVNVNGRNPNVFYELGICHAIGKPVIIVSKSKIGLPFDISDKNIIFYKEPLDLQTKIKDELLKIFIDIHHK